MDINKQDYRKAGITLEVSLVLPLFLFFLWMLFSVFDMMCLHAEMDSALRQVGEEMSAYAYVFEAYQENLPESRDSSFLRDMFLKEGYAKSRVISIVGRERINNSLIIGGVNGITLWRSDFMENNGVLDLTMTYRVRPWFSFSGIGEMTLMNRCYIRAYTGYEPEQKEVSGEKYYIADYAEVYHTNRECTHLRLTISYITEEELPAARNLYGQKYTECEICYSEELTEDGLYIALQGDRYHSVISCSGLKRTVYTVSQKEILGLPLCSRCAKEGD